MTWNWFSNHVRVVPASPTPRAIATGITRAATFACLALWGCSTDPTGSSPYDPHIEFVTWDSLSTGACRGVVRNGGVVAATFVHVELLYATSHGESSGVVPVGDFSEFDPAYPDDLYATFITPPQWTAGELRYPRVGRITWRSGQASAQPRAPVMHVPMEWDSVAADTAELRISNDGGWAYRVAATVENRNGLEVIPAAPSPVGHQALTLVRSVARESSGVSVAPRLVRLDWEDYAGMRDSLVPGAP